MYILYGLDAKDREVIEEFLKFRERGVISVEKEILLILSLFQKRWRNYVFDAMCLISILFLLERGVRIDLWFIIVVAFVSILMISFGEVLRENVKRNLKLGHRSIRNYRKYLTTWKNTRKMGFKEFLKVMKTVPLPWRLMKIYLVIIAFYLFTYIYIMYFTVIQGLPETSILFVIQLSVILLVYSSTFVRLFGKLQRKST